MIVERGGVDSWGYPVDELTVPKAITRVLFVRGTFVETMELEKVIACFFNLCVRVFLFLLPCFSPKIRPFLFFFPHTFLYTTVVLVTTTKKQGTKQNKKKTKKT